MGLKTIHNVQILGHATAYSVSWVCDCGHTNHSTIIGEGYHTDVCMGCKDFSVMKAKPE